MKRWIALACLLSGAVAQNACPPEPSVGLATELTQGFPPEIASPQARQNIIGRIDRALREDYFDPKIAGRDFGAIRLKAVRATSERGFYDALREWIDGLGDGFSFFSSRREQNPPPLAQNFAGIGVSLSSNTSARFRYVWWVRPEGPASGAGIKVGDRLLAVEGDTCPKIASIRGPEGSVVKLTVQTRGEAPRQIQVTRARIQASGNPPTVFSQTLDANTAYLRIAQEPSDDELASALVRLNSDKPMQGLVLDLRGADLYSGQSIRNIVGHFSSGMLYRFSGRNINGGFVSSSQPHLDKLPLAVLVDPTASDVAQWITGILNNRTNTVVIGARLKPDFSSGRDVELPDGSALFLKTGVFQLAKNAVEGIEWPQSGLEPTVLISEDWFAFKEADDPHIKAALEALSKLK